MNEEFTNKELIMKTVRLPIKGKDIQMVIRYTIHDLLYKYLLSSYQYQNKNAVLIIICIVI